MADKKKVVAFKVEAELAEILDKLPNKSAFIRKAIFAQLGGVTCPTCKGEGMIPRGLQELLSTELPEHGHRDCAGCGDELTVPFEIDTGELTEEDRERMQQFFFGGPLYCNTCFEKAPTCGECGWHVDPEQFSQHHQQAHRND